MEEQANINDAVMCAEMLESQSGRFYIAIDRESDQATLGVVTCDTEETIKLQREEVAHLRDFLSNVLRKSQILNDQHNL